MEHKTFYNVEVKSDDDLLQVDAIVSTEHRDRGGDVLLADGMRVNGAVVVLMAHGQSSSGQEPIAKLISLDKVQLNGKRGVRARVKFFPDDLGRRLFAKVRDGYLINWSIGWVPIEWRHRTEDDGSQTRVVSVWELLELSPVAVGMNPQAQTVSGSAKGQEMWFKFLGDGQMSDGYTFQEEPRQTITIPDDLIAKIFQETVPGIIKKAIQEAKGKVR